MGNQRFDRRGAQEVNNSLVADASLADNDEVHRDRASVLGMLLITGCAAAPDPEALSVLKQGNRSDEPADLSDDDSGDDDSPANDDSQADEDSDSEPSNDAPESMTSAGEDSSTKTSKVDAGSDGATASANRDGGASREAGASVAADAGTSIKDAGRADSATPVSPPAASASCNPSACQNNCLLLNRCCDVSGQCACEEPLTRQCTLPSLPGLR